MEKPLGYIQVGCFFFNSISLVYQHFFPLEKLEEKKLKDLIWKNPSVKKKMTCVIAFKKKYFTNFIIIIDLSILVSF